MILQSEVYGRGTVEMAESDYLGADALDSKRGLDSSAPEERVSTMQTGITPLYSARYTVEAGESEF